MNKFTKYILTIAVISSFSLLKTHAQDLNSLSRSLDSLQACNPQKALSTAKKIEKIAKKQNANLFLIQAYKAQAKLYYQKKSYSKSINYFEKELKIEESESLSSNLSEAYYNLASTCLKLNKNKKAENNFKKSLQLAKESNLTDLINANYRALVVVNEKNYNYKEANSFIKLILEESEGNLNSQINLYKKQVVKQKQIVRHKSKQLKTTQKSLDTVNVKLVQSSKTIGILEEDTLRKKLEISSLNFQKVLKDMELKSTNEELQVQKKFTYLLIIGVSGVSILTLLVFFLLQAKKKMNLKLKSQKKEIEKQKDSITQSIIYAKKIQQAILPNEQIFKNNFRDYFIVFKPRDIVSGDFYFIQKVNNYIIFAAVDCTGHGVPGGFMSMLGQAFLNDIIRKKEVTKASQILNLLRDEIKLSLQQKGVKGEQKDGMDMAICVIDTQSNQLQFAGAHNPLIMVRSRKLTEIKADRMPVGIHIKEREFTNHTLQLQKEDQLYIFSDGFADQLGEESQKKYKSKPFKKLLLSNSDLSMAEQKEKLITVYQQWKGTIKQTDDIVIIGVKI